MIASGPTSHYSLGSTDAEHERLIWQASRLAPLTERLFREAGIGPGQRVLDLGSGVGDVAMLVARMVGPSGEVVGVERDTRSTARARARVAEAGLRNVNFTESDVNQLANDKPFDAAVGRFILEFLPDPLAALRRAELHFFIGKEHSVWCRIIVNLSNNIASKSLKINAPISWFHQRSPANHDVGPKLEPAVEVA
jgi:protein-L-isoaspartate O-methyltransferase